MSTNILFQGGIYSILYRELSVGTNHHLTKSKNKSSPLNLSLTTNMCWFNFYFLVTYNSCLSCS